MEITTSSSNFGFGKCYEWYTAAGGLKTLCQVLPPSWSLSAALVREVPTGQFIAVSWTAALEMLPYLYIGAVRAKLHVKRRADLLRSLLQRTYLHKMEKGLTAFALFLPPSADCCQSFHYGMVLFLIWIAGSTLF